MKKHFILLLFLFLNFSAQEIANQDCNEYFKKEKKELTFFKEKNIKEKQKFAELRKTVFNNIPKEFLIGKNICVSIYANTFINDNITSQCSSRSTLSHDKNLFLDQLFWSKNTFEYVSKKLKKSLIPIIGSIRSRQTVNKDFINGLKNEGYYQFMLDFPEFTDHNNRMAFYYSGNRQNLKPDISDTKVVVNFSRYEPANEVVVEFYRTRDDHLYTYQYIDNQWKLINTEKHRY